jgi:hypothetical protein
VRDGVKTNRADGEYRGCKWKLREAARRLSMSGAERVEDDEYPSTNGPFNRRPRVVSSAGRRELRS